ncbi:hypothetical protein OH786_11300 [Streptomyces atratus]|uniref:Uncharacterized protein n=1 Tax=Streptomyces atratus TaxID=1893 RepID=A0A1K2F3T3_STRAR|nr:MULTISPECIES: hypothetical protein [Streptomyces]WSD68502.1 hypothetical protein OG978_14470 [Streptomyces sp. NBC_01591]SFY42487.1 hypothetical protein SAMN02787144_103063 [Streptomyces atratus]
MTGIDAAAALQRELPAAKVVVITFGRPGFPTGRAVRIAREKCWL